MPTSSNQNERIVEIKRPLRLTLLALFFLGVAAWMALRVGSSIYFWNALQEGTAHPLYIALSGVVWLVLAIILFIGIWKGRPWAWPLTIFSTILYVGWYWLDRVFQSTSHPNLFFSIAATLIFSLYVMLSILSKRSRLYFRRKIDERKPTNPTSA